jgi:hypothetical protein
MSNRENDTRRNGLIGTVRAEFHAHNASAAMAIMITNLRFRGFTDTEILVGADSPKPGDFSSG